MKVCNAQAQQKCKNKYYRYSFIHNFLLRNIDYIIEILD